MASHEQYRGRRSDKSCKNLDWDDTALIKAYDRAMNQVKEKVEKKREEGSYETRGPPKENKGHKKKWKVNDFCRAIYSEDNVAYESIITNINEDDDSCTVIFIGYENEEEVQLSSLLQSYGRSARKKQKMESRKSRYAASQSDSIGDDSSIYSGRTSSCSEQKKHSMHVHESSHWRPEHDSLHYENVPKSPFCPPMPHGPVLNAGSTLPPPMPFFPNTNASTENSLASMLMSWYMAGYHTGMHQGLQIQQSNSHHHSSVDMCSHSCCHKRNH